MCKITINIQNSQIIGQKTIVFGWMVSFFVIFLPKKWRGGILAAAHRLYPKKQSRLEIPIGISVPRKGLEPSHLAAHAPETCASTNSATWACVGDPGGTRTHDPVIKSQLLYQLSYGVKMRRLAVSFAGAKLLPFSGLTKFFCKKNESPRFFSSLAHARTFYIL